ncbi:hypothetical protein PUNSTDRAFT_37529, partial [Punctularia strigosozonata HHB-11173 SS5]
CYQCGEEIKSTSTRNHVGGHILREMCRRSSQPIEPGIVLRDPCGFCGREGTCETTLAPSSRNPSGTRTAAAGPSKTRTKTYSVCSTCPHAHEFKYGNARKSTSNTPCSNVPIECTLC